MRINRNFTEACGFGDLVAAKKYLKQGADIHVWHDEALRHAANNGHLETVKYLVENGADVHVASDLPLQWAAEEGRLEVVKYLIEQGANIHVLNDWPLRIAILNGHSQMANCLRRAAGPKYKCHNCIIKSTCLDLCEDFRNGN